MLNKGKKSFHFFSEKKISKVDLINIVLSIIAIFISIFSIRASLSLEKEFRYMEEMNQRIENTKALSFANNIEFWDHSINVLLQSITDDFGLTNEIKDITFCIADKQIGAALELLNKNERLLKTNDNYLLLKSCLIVREYIRSNDYLLNRTSPHTLEISLLESQRSEDHRHKIVLGILYYYSGNYTQAIDTLQHSIEVYAKDSTYYDIANYWLALLSIKTRNNVCDLEHFLSSSFNDNTKLLPVMKSSLAFLFGSELDYLLLPLSPVYFRNNETEHHGVYHIPYSIVNPAHFLDSDDTERIFETTSWDTQADLYFLYNSLATYSRLVASGYQITTGPEADFEEAHPEICSFLDSLDCNTPFSFNNFQFILDPRTSVDEYKSCFEEWYNLIANNFIRFGINGCVPLIDIIDRFIFLSRIHSTEEFDPAEYSFKYVFEFWYRHYINSDEDSCNKALYATLVLRYSEYIGDFEFDKEEAAKLSYNHGYRFSFVTANL